MTMIIVIFLSCLICLFFRSTNTFGVKGNVTVKIDFFHSDDSTVTDVEPLILDPLPVSTYLIIILKKAV